MDRQSQIEEAVSACGNEGMRNAAKSGGSSTRQTLGLGNGLDVRCPWGSPVWKAFCHRVLVAECGCNWLAHALEQEQGPHKLSVPLTPACFWKWLAGSQKCNWLFTDLVPRRQGRVACRCIGLVG